MPHSIIKKEDGDCKKNFQKGKLYNISRKQTAIIKFVKYDSETDQTILRLVK